MEVEWKTESSENKAISTTSLVCLIKKRIGSYFDYDDVNPMWYSYFPFVMLLKLKKLYKILFFINFSLFLLILLK